MGLSGIISSEKSDYHLPRADTPQHTLHVFLNREGGTSSSCALYCRNCRFGNEVIATVPREAPKGDNSYTIHLRSRWIFARGR